jgi:hypothetical protein
LGNLYEMERNSEWIWKQRNTTVVMNAFLAWKYKFKNRVNQQRFMLAIHSKRTRELLVTAFKDWRRVSLYSRAIEVESIIKSNVASTHLNKGSVFLSNTLVKLSAIFHQWRRYHHSSIAKSLRKSKSTNFYIHKSLTTCTHLWRRRVLHKSWTRKTSNLASALYNASLLHRMFSVWSRSRDWDAVVYKRMRLPVLYWADWRVWSAFRAWVDWCWIRKEEKEMVKRVDEWRAGMLRRIGVRGVIVAADEAWEKRLNGIKGMDEKSGRLRLRRCDS